MKKTVIVIALLAAVACAAVADNIWWIDDSSELHRWDNPENWSAGRVPMNRDRVYIGQGWHSHLYPEEYQSLHTRIPVITDGMDLEIQSLTINGGPEDQQESHTLIMTGGSLLIGTRDEWSHYLMVGCAGITGTRGTLVLTGGSIDVRQCSIGGWEGSDGYLVMSGGSLRVRENLHVPAGTPGFGYVYLSGGVMQVDGQLKMGDDRDAHTGRFDLCGGRLEVEGDWQESISGYVEQGLMFAYGGTGSVSIAIEDGVTVVTGER